MEIGSYQPGEFYDELFLPDGSPRSIAATLIEKIGSLSLSELQQYQQLAQSTLLRIGATFNVYSDDLGTEKILPFDIIPRTICDREWTQLRARFKATYPRTQLVFERYLWGSKELSPMALFPKS